MGVLGKLRTFINTHFWSKSRNVGTLKKTIDFNVEYYKVDLLFDYTSVEHGFLL